MLKNIFSEKIILKKVRKIKIFEKIFKNVQKSQKNSNANFDFSKGILKFPLKICTFFREHFRFFHNRFFQKFIFRHEIINIFWWMFFKNILLIHENAFKEVLEWLRQFENTKPSAQNRVTKKTSTFGTIKKNSCYIKQKKRCTEWNTVLLLKYLLINTEIPNSE